jgi:hypothetical protein
MSELSVIDDDGEEHSMWLQEEGDTCGPACVYMIERDRRQQSIIGGEQRVTFLTSLLPNGYVEGKGTQAYTALKDVLGRIGIKAAAMKVASMTNFVGDGFFPFIARVGWTNGGGHFVVARKVTASGLLVCLDPWYGLVQPAVGSLPTYNVQRDYRGQRSLAQVAGGTLSGHVVFPNAD